MQEVLSYSHPLNFKPHTAGTHGRFQDRFLAFNAFSLKLGSNIILAKFIKAIFTLVHTHM